jgi:hypothetical protein
MYPRIPWELFADSFESAEHTLETTDLRHAVVPLVWIRVETHPFKLTNCQLLKQDSVPWIERATFRIFYIPKLLSSLTGTQQDFAGTLKEEAKIIV